MLADDVVPLCAAFAAQEHGDARKAIDALRHAGEHARDQNDTKITERHVRTAQKIAEKERFRELVENATIQEKLILLSRAELDLRYDDHVFKTSRVYNGYETICHHIGVDALSIRRIRDLLEEQAFLGTVEIEKVGGGRERGVYRTNQLLEDAELVRDPLMEDIRLTGWKEIASEL